MLTAPRFLMSGDWTETGAGAVEPSSRRFCWGMERSRRLPGAILNAFVATGSGVSVHGRGGDFGGARSVRGRCRRRVVIGPVG